MKRSYWILIFSLVGWIYLHLYHFSSIPLVIIFEPNLFVADFFAKICNIKKDKRRVKADLEIFQKPSDLVGTGCPKIYSQKLHVERGMLSKCPCGSQIYSLFPPVWADTYKGLSSTWKNYFKKNFVDDIYIYVGKLF